MRPELSQQQAGLSGRAFQLSVGDLVRHEFLYGEALLHGSGAVVVDTRPTTSRAEKRNFKVGNPYTTRGMGSVGWGGYNLRFTKEEFDRLRHRMLTTLEGSERLYKFVGYIGADPKNRIGVTVITDRAYIAHFANLLFFQSEEVVRRSDLPQAAILCSPDVFVSDTNQEDYQEGVFIISNYHPELSTVLIGGTKYPGEVKKAMFTLADWLFPQRGVLPMHCSATLNEDGSSTLFFGLSGTGKTTLSAQNGNLIGDDETVWSDEGISNLEAGCYAKCVGLDRIREAHIWNATHQKGALIENVPMDHLGQLDFSLNAALYRPDGRGGTENTRVAYPLEFIPNALEARVHPRPRRIVFLTYDASGVLPPVAKLKDVNTALYYFLLGYTSKVAGTVRGVKGIEPTFSACFGAPFMPLHPKVYARLLKEKIEKHKVEVYLVNTGLQGGGHRQGGKRISLEDTVAIVNAITGNQLSGTDTTFTAHRIFNRLAIPTHVPGLKNQSILFPEHSWTDKGAYNKAAMKLKGAFNKQMQKMAGVPYKIKSAGP